MKPIPVLILLLLILGTYSCHPPTSHLYLNIKNMSSKAISVTMGDQYPDTTISCPMGYFEISAGTEYEVYLHNSWEDAFKGMAYFQFFVIDSITNKTYPCDTVKIKNLILKRYQLSLVDIENLNWTIIYP